MEDTTHAFLTLSAFDFPIDKTRVILVDRPHSGPPLEVYMGMWMAVWEVRANIVPSV